MSSPHALTNIDIVSNNSSSSVVSSEVKRWATAARHEIAIGGHDTATPIFQPLILQALAAVGQQLWNYWVQQYETDFKNRAITQADIIYDPNRPGHIRADEQMDLLYGAWSDDYGVPLLGSLGNSQLDSADTRLMTLFTTTSAALSIARLPIEPTLVTICTICNSALHNGQTCICPCTGTQREMQSPAETIAYSDRDDSESHLTCNGCNRPINTDNGVASCIRCARDLHLAPDNSGPLCRCPCPVLGMDSGSESDDNTQADANRCPVCCRPITSSSRYVSILEPCNHICHWRCLLSAFTIDERCPLCRGEVQQLRDLHTSAIANNDNVPNPPANSYQIDQLTMDLIDALERPEMYVEGDPLPTDDHFSTPASSVPISSASSVLDTTFSTDPGSAPCVVGPSTTNIVDLSSDVNRPASSSGMSEVAPSSDMSEPDGSETRDATVGDCNHDALVYPTVCPNNSTVSCTARPFSTPEAIALHIRRVHTPLLAEQKWIVTAAGLQTCPNCNEPRKCQLRP
eukprot:g65699.t1